MAGARHSVVSSAEALAGALGDRVAVRPLKFGPPAPSDKGITHVGKHLKFIGIDLPGEWERLETDEPGTETEADAATTDTVIAAPVEPHDDAEDPVGNALAQQHLFEDPRLRVRAVQHRGLGARGTRAQAPLALPGPPRAGADHQLAGL